jgi:16S rRNA (guanine527-N7)-methyltransferase
MMDAANVTVAGLSVSRETFAALRQLEALVQRWTPVVNLVSKATVPDIWTRHILDSAQLFAACPANARHWADLGSGGGFPGLVVAILAKQLNAELNVTLVESDLRKATFLRQAAQALSLSVAVLSQRVESLPPLDADVVSARALARLSDLLGHADRHLRPDGVAIFPKGAQYEAEVAEARLKWSFDVDIRTSLSDSDAAILIIGAINRGRN